VGADDQRAGVAVKSRLGATLCFIAVAASAAGAQTPPPAVPPPVAGPTFAPGTPATPPAFATPAPAGTTAPPALASPAAAATTVAPAGIATPTTAPTVAPTPAYVQYTGQLLDVRPGEVFFTTGDVFATVEPLRIIDADTGLPTSKTPAVKMFARATFDPASHKIVELAITRRRLQMSTSEAQIADFALPVTNGDKAPELAGPAITGKQVAVVFEVTVPPTTSLTDEIYISTDVSQWNPEAIRLDRTDAYRYRAVRYFASGTKFAYRVTRGTWNSVERGEDNLDAPAHNFFVREVDSLVARVTVYHWSDENPAAQGAGPNSIPTPYNSNPFAGGPGSIQVPQVPTPAPTPHR
jgi:hypothetical protein